MLPTTSRSYSRDRLSQASTKVAFVNGGQNWYVQITLFRCVVDYREVPKEAYPIFGTIFQQLFACILTQPRLMPSIHFLDQMIHYFLKFITLAANETKAVIRIQVTTKTLSDTTTTLIC